VKEHWQIYKSLARDLRKRATWERVEVPRQKRFLEMAEFIETEPKFYVPDMSLTAWEEARDVGTHNDNFIRLPYPKTVVLMDTIMGTGSSDSGTIESLAREHNPDYDLMRYAKELDEASRKVSHVPTVVLAEQCEGSNDIEIMAGAWNVKNEEWCPYAAKMLMVPQEHGYKLMLAANDLATAIHVSNFRKVFKGGAEEIVEEQFNTCLLSLLFLHMLLSLENVEVSKRGAPKLSIVGTRGQKKKRRAHKSFDYHVLSINGEAWDSPYESNNGGHGGVRSHLRRGHIRKFSNGKTTWVRAAYIKGSKEGFVKKDYDILGSN
jgi:hypothetical protein